MIDTFFVVVNTHETTIKHGKAIAAHGHSHAHTDAHITVLISIQYSCMERKKEMGMGMQ